MAEDQKICHTNMPLQPMVPLWRAFLHGLPMAIVQKSAMPLLPFKQLVQWWRERVITLYNLFP